MKNRRKKKLREGKCKLGRQTVEKLLEIHTVKKIVEVDPDRAVLAEVFVVL